MPAKGEQIPQTVESLQAIMERDAEIMLALQGAANFLRGMTFDPRLPNDIPSACLHKATELDEVLEKHLETI